MKHVCILFQSYNFICGLLQFHFCFYIMWDFPASDVMGWDSWLFNSYEAYCLCVGNHSGHNLHTWGWGDMKMKGQPNLDLNPLPSSQGSNRVADWANEASWSSDVMCKSCICIIPIQLYSNNVCIRRIDAENSCLFCIAWLRFCACKIYEWCKVVAIWVFLNYLLCWIGFHKYCPFW